MVSDPAKKIQAGEALPTSCSSIDGGGFCFAPYYIDITFPTPFNTVPIVAASFERMFSPNGCLAGSADAVHAAVTNITTTGFRLWAGASPVPGYCGPHDNSWYYAYAMWIATTN